MNRLIPAAALIVFVCALAPLATAQTPAAPNSACRMGLVADLPVTFARNRPTVPVTVDGHPLTALLDTGAGLTILFADTAQRLGIKTRVEPNFRMYGVDGETAGAVAHVRFGMMGKDGPPNDMIVTGKSSPGVDMLLGEDILSQTDLELDFAHDKARLLKPVGCADDQMAYWAQTWSEARFTDDDRSIHLDVILNGVRVNALLDSGAAASVATDAVAFRADVSFGDDKADKGKGSGVAGKLFEIRRGRVRSVSIGDETVGSTVLQFGPLYQRREVADSGTRIALGSKMEMLLGADFLKAHRVLVSRSRGKLYFTYNGGPIFRPEATLSTETPPKAASPKDAPGTPP